MRFLLIIAFLFAQNLIYAQKESYNWIWGTCRPDLGFPCEGLVGTGIMKFNDDSLESIATKYFPASFSLGSATISDANGNFLMAFNGKSLFDSSGSILAELSELPYDDIILGYRGFMFLKPRINDNYYYLVNSYSGNFSNSPNPFDVGIDTLFLLTKIKYDENGYNVLGTIHISLPLNTIPGGFDVCRHANGRDWWVLKCGHRKNYYLKGLLNPYDFEFEPYYTNLDSAFTSFQWASFSSDGSKYFHWFGGYIRELQVFDFDRCTGELSNLHTYDFTSIISNEGFIDFTPFSLSPDGTKIYMQKTNYITMNDNENIQYDLSTGEFTVVTDDLAVLCSTPNLKHMIGGFCCEPTTPTPNVPYAGVVFNPNLPGESCNYQSLFYQLPLYGFTYSPPYAANHLLGPIDETICDSLGLNDETAIKKIETFNINLFPNPGTTVLNFKTDLPLPVKLIIRDSQGKLILDKLIFNKAFIVSDELRNMKSGIYYIELQNEKTQIRLSKKWMKIE